MHVDSVGRLIAELAEYHLLEAARCAELTARASEFGDAAALVREIVRRGWLTSFQGNELALGRGSGLRLGSYVLLERLGEGGMGQVFKASHALMRRVVAIKVVRPECLADPTAVARFRREIALIAQLAHPHIVTAHDALEDGGRHFLVMEYCAGRTLGCLVRAEGPLPLARACDWVRQAALGLHHVHERGLIHRDVKPDNLIVTASGVKVLDLGLARLRLTDGSDDSPTAVTPSGVFLGTPDFMAPEQARDGRGVDGRADVYALGCTLYFALAGQVPFPGGTPMEKLLRHQLEEPEPLARLRPEIPAAVVAVVRRAMAKAPAARYSTAAALAAALKPVARTADAPPILNSTEASVVLGMAPCPPFREMVPARPVSRMGTGGPGGGGATAEAGLRGEGFASRPRPRRRRPSIRLLLTALVLVVAALSLGSLLVSLSRKPSSSAAPPGAAVGNGGGPDAESNRPPPLPGPPLTPLDKWKLRLTVEPGPRESIHGATFAPDSRRLAVAYGTRWEPYEPGSVEVWDVPGRGLLFPRLPVAGGEVRCVAFSPDGRTLAAGVGTIDNPNKQVFLEGRVYLWDAGSGAPKEGFTGQKKGVMALAFSPRTGRLAVAGKDGTVGLWDVSGDSPRAGETLEATRTSSRPWPSRRTAAGWPAAARTGPYAFGAWTTRRPTRRCSCRMGAIRSPRSLFPPTAARSPR